MTRLTELAPKKKVNYNVVATWPCYVILLVIISNNIPLSLPIALIYHLVPDNSLFWYTKPHLSIVKSRISIWHYWEVHQPLSYLLGSIPSIILLQFWYLLTNILFVKMWPYLIGSCWGSRSSFKGLQFASQWLGYFIANFGLDHLLAWFWESILDSHEALGFWDHDTSGRRHGLLDTTSTTPWCFINPIAARKVDLLEISKELSEWVFRL